MKIKILIPIYNDWQSLIKILENINSEISNLNYDFSVIIVNDASTESRSEISANIDNFSSVKIINMKVNKGHARCNASGLKYIFDKEEFDYIIPMDGDGEDRPEEIKLLVSKMSENPERVIVGERIKRSEGIFFKFCYFIHKIITQTFTGKSIKFGNYTCLPKSIVEKMIDEKATWSSFSGSLTKISTDRISIPSIREQLITESDDTIRRLNWTSDKGRSFLLQTMNTTSRQNLDNEALIEFNELLKNEFNEINTI